VAGFGGILVELFKDTSVELASVTHAETRSMLRRLKGARLLNDFRGSAPIDIDRLAQVICPLSEFAADQADRLAELDVNPLTRTADRIVAVDALIALRPHIQ
jgi:hypothetical protein